MTAARTLALTTEGKLLADGIAADLLKLQEHMVVWVAAARIPVAIRAAHLQLADASAGSARTGYAIECKVREARMGLRDQQIGRRLFGRQW